MCVCVSVYVCVCVSVCVCLCVCVYHSLVGRPLKPVYSRPVIHA